MARKTVISKVLDVEAQDGIIEFPQNRALYADQFTDEAPQSDDEREGFKAKSMKDVFEHYQPSKKGIALENEEGGAVYEDFDFKSIKDFEDEQLIDQSALLGAAKDKIDAYNGEPINYLDRYSKACEAYRDATNELLDRIGIAHPKS